MAACPTCGTQTAPDARFCPSCGAAQAIPVASAVPPVSGVPPITPGAAPVGVAAAPAVSVNTWMMLCHLSALAGLVIPSLGHVLGPLIVWLVKKDEFPQVDIEGKESLNFQISMSIYAIVSSLFIWVLIGIPMLIAVAVADVVLTVVASVKTSQGVLYRYPFTIRFLK